MVTTSLLQHSKVFSQLSTVDIQQVVALGQVTTYAPNQLIFKAGAAAQHVAVLLAGGLHVVDVLDDGRLCHVGTLRAGDSVGWVSAIDNLPMASHVLAASADTQVLLVPFKVIHALLAQRPVFSQAVLSIMASTIRHYMRTRAALSAPSVAQRIYRVILGLAHDGGKDALVILPKQQELAVLANTSRETVSRTLQELIRRGILQKNGHQISILNIDALAHLTHAQTSD